MLLHTLSHACSSLFLACLCAFLIFFRFYLLERGEGREKEREEKHQCVVASSTPPTGDLAHNPGMGPDWESNQWPFGSQAGTQSTEPHQSRLSMCFLYLFFYCVAGLFLIGFTGLPYKWENYKRNFLVAICIWLCWGLFFPWNLFK